MPDLAPGAGLRIGSGIIRFKRDGANDFRDLGEFSNFEITPEIDKLDYKSNKLGTKSVVKSIIREKKATLAITLNSITDENLGDALGGDVTTVGTDHKRFGLFSENVIPGIIALEGTNDEGVQLDYTGRVELAPEGAFSPISEEWNELSMTGEILADEDGNFGFYDIRTGATYSPPDLEGTA
jgi:hypothetical protein